jgi:hypothetical protein
MEMLYDIRLDPWSIGLYDERMGSKVHDVDTEQAKALRKIAGRRKGTPEQRAAAAATKERMRSGHVFADADARRRAPATTPKRAGTA